MSVRSWRLEKVKPKHIREAARVWERRAEGLCEDILYAGLGFEDSRKYDVIIDGAAYPPKPIGSYAHRLAGDRFLSKGEFGGAKGGKWHRRFQELGFDVVYKGTNLSVFSESALACDIERIIVSRNLSETEKISQIFSRIGQSQFRDLMFNIWGGCAVTGSKVSAVLRASHIKPWCESNSKERLDADNGLLLSANLDALFDRNLISFNDDGGIIISPFVKISEYPLLGLSAKLSLEKKKMSKGMKRYMEDHRKRLV